MMDTSHWMGEWLQQLVVWLSVGLPGLPPGTPDPQLVQVIPGNAVLVAHWDGQGRGQPGAPGIQGAAADPELRQAARALQKLAQHFATASTNQTDGTDWPAVLRLAFRHPGCLCIAPGRIDFSQPGGLNSLFQIGVILNPGTDADTFLADFVPLLPTQLAAVTDAAAPATPAPPVTFRRVGDRLVWGTGTFAAELESRLIAASVSGFTPPAGRLSNSSPFQQSQQELQAQHAGSFLWFQLSGATAQLALSSLPLPLEWRDQVSSGLAQFQGVRFLAVSQLEDGHVVGRFVLDGGPLLRQLIPLQPTISQAALQRVPADADFVVALGCDLAVVTQQLLAGIERSLPRRDPEAPSLATQLQRELGQNLERDVIPAFGSTWIVSSSRSTGGAFGLGPVFSLETRNPRDAYAVFTQAMTWLQRVVATSTSLRMTNELYDDRTLYILQSTQAFPQGFAPCFCITDRELLVTLQPQTMRAHLRFLERGGPHFAARVANESLWQAESVAGVYIDAPRLTEVIWPLVPMAANAHLNQFTELGLGFDGSVWPSAAAVLEYSQPCSASLRMTPNGCVGELRNPLSLAAPVLAGNAFWLLQRVGPPQRSPSGSEPPRLDIDLGQPMGIEAAAAVQPETSDQATGVQTADYVTPPAPRPARPWLSGLLRSLTPDDVEVWIPDAAFQRIEQGADPERQRRREQRRLERERRLESAP